MRMRAIKLSLTEDIDENKLLQFSKLRNGKTYDKPFTFMVAEGVVSKANIAPLSRDYPEISKTGFLPLGVVERKGTFDELMKELEGPELAELLSEKLQVELRDKPRMITIRKWSAANDGRIHNDSEAKIVTALLYLNETWPETEDGGRFRILSGNESYDQTTHEVEPVFGNFVAFRRSDNSWHGHKPFVGERRVVQITWLRSAEDLVRKEKRGRFSLFLKKLSQFKIDY